MDNFEQGSTPGLNQAPDQEPFLGRIMLEGAPSAEIRNWRAPVYMVCGYCTPQDIAAFCYGLLCPWINFGHNMQRALKLNAFFESFLAFMFTLVTLLVVHGLLNQLCPVPQSEIDIPDLPGFDPEDPNPLCKKGTLLGYFSKHACYEPGTTCYNAQYARYVAIVIVFLFYCYVAYRRSQVRFRHGLPGNGLCDFCYNQWCCLCTLCQETRTYWYYNVQEGDWLGQIYKGHYGELYDDPYNL